MDIKNLAAEAKDYVIELRREFHMYPEKSGEEIRTSRRVKEELDKMGIPNINAGETGVIATIKGEKPGKTVALKNRRFKGRYGCPRSLRKKRQAL